MYFVIGLSAVAALIFVLWLIAKVLKFLVVSIAGSIKRLVSFRRKPRAKQAKVPPTMTLPAVDRDWDSTSRETRRSLLERGPRASRETSLLSNLDLEIAIGQKRQELQSLMAQLANPRNNQNAIRGDLFGLGRQELPSQQTAVSGGFGPLSSKGQADRTRVVETSHFMH
jgi:hypothetical protein